MSVAADKQAEFEAAVSAVEVLDVAGRILANPDRAMVSLAAKVAMASVIERLNEIAIEAAILVGTVEGVLPLDQTPDAEACEHLILQAGHVGSLIAALRRNPETKAETEDASHHP